MMTGHVTHGSFPAMSTSVALIGVGVTASAMADATERARQLAEAWEQRFSRFRPESLLCRLNAAGGQALPVDVTFCALLARAAQAVRETGGRFDPSVLPVLEALGYDRSIDQVRAAPAEPRHVPAAPESDGAAGTWRSSAGAARTWSMLRSYPSASSTGRTDGSKRPPVSRTAW
ncbi:MAG: FAD:protein FMN transferase, partial [Chloroflexia bacterium]|nr:FAD:protein FMN transferase [Chloroflexia bacterium]